MASETESKVIYEARDGRAYITINRDEKRNAMTYGMFDEISEYVKEAERDDDVRVVVFKGRGRDFSTGHDLIEVFGDEYGFSEDPKAPPPSQRARLHFDKKHIEQFRDIFYCTKPTLCLIQGHCFGAGLHLVESTDLAIAATDAVIGHPEQKIGLAGAAYTTTWCIMALGPRKARELLLLGQTMTGSEAAEIGLVNKAVPPGELDAAGEEWAERIVRLPRDAIAIGKAATHMAMDSLGMTSQFIHSYVAHALGTNIRYEADEFDFWAQRRERGAAEAMKLRERWYDDKK